MATPVAARRATIAHLPAFGAGHPLSAQISRGLEWCVSRGGHRLAVSGTGRGVTSSIEQELRHRIPLTPLYVLPEVIDRARVLLVAWPERSLLERLAPGGGLVPEHTDLCVLRWGTHSWITDWLTAHGAIDLTPQIAAPERTQAS